MVNSREASQHEPVEARGAAGGRYRADRVLVWAAHWVSRKNREEIFGDLREDVADFRQAGLSEGQILRRVGWQIVWAVLQRPIVWKSAIAAWLLRQMSAMLGSG